MKKESLGFIGLGVMGHSMCTHLLDAGYPVHVFNRTKSKAEGVLAKGAVWEDSPARVAKAVDIVFTMLGFPQDVEQVYFGENGLFSASHAGECFVDMTTTKPSLSLSIAKRAEELGCQACDAPVSGGDTGAKNATLSIMVGAERSVYERLIPFFRILGKATYEGGPGTGQHTKMSNQIVIAGTMAGMCEALLYARKAGLDEQTMLDTIKTGAAGCWSLDNLAPRVIKGDYEPGFMIDHFVKDMGIALEESKKMGLCLPTLALVQQLYIALQGLNLGKLGTQALVLALDRVSGAGCFKEN
ncbi:MAG: NAD(P)-dependent oxidoreductase [Sphaerochaetaceae bacterium]